MLEMLYTGLVTAEELQQVVDHCHFTRDALFLAEQLPSHVITGLQERQNLLRFAYFEGGAACSEYTSGRIFQEDRELRWEKQTGKHAGKIRVVYLGQADNETELQEDRLSKKKEFDTFIRSELKYYYLFGERLRASDLKKLGKVALPGDFAVVRIPRILRYPVPQNSQRYVRLAVCEYLDAATGRIALFRFQGLETLGEVV
jgi:hypothetical protein